VPNICTSVNSTSVNIICTKIMPHVYIYIICSVHVSKEAIGIFIPYYNVSNAIKCYSYNF
jgi:hypothetical protein